jgi:phenylacetate-CoA ligase
MQKLLYFGAHRLIGSSLGRCYTDLLRADAQVCAQAGETATQTALARLLRHCAANVPYYAGLIRAAGDGYEQDAAAYLRRLPLLTKDLVREHFTGLTSRDLAARRWVYNTSGGSTGEPVKLIQDREYQDRQMAIQLLSFQWAGRRFGEPALRIWGSERDILQGSERWQMRLLNRLSNDRYLNAFDMTPAKMHRFLAQLNARPPKLIVAYAQAIYELARFAQRQSVAVRPQHAILTSAGTLYPWMRAAIEAVFGCPVFNRYGSREVGDIACECSEHTGLHVFPWGNYVEIVDEEGQPVPAGVEGDIVVTNLNNYAMPLVRYFIGDRGTLSPAGACACGRRGQMLQTVSGRNIDVFKKRDGTLVDGAFFFHMLYYRDWVHKFQIVQADYEWMVFRVATTQSTYDERELDEIVRETRLVMGADCKVDFEFLDDIAPSPSGKYRYAVSHVPYQPLLQTG